MLMNIRMNSRLLIVSLLLSMLPLYSMAEDSLDFNDGINRQAEDFVEVSLMIADPTDWRDDVLGTKGHAFLRLECPTFNLDYCFSYEGENVNDNLFRYLTGKTKMGMFAISTNEYLEDYRQWNRSVHAYHLAMPPEAEQRLWEIMDNHLTNGLTLRQDLNKYGCALTAVKYVKRAMGDTPIIYAEEDCSGSLPPDEMSCVPVDVAAVWQRATVNGQPFATYVGDIVEGAPLDEIHPWRTAVIAALGILLLLASICAWIVKARRKAKQ